MDTLAGSSPVQATYGIVGPCLWLRAWSYYRLVFQYILNACMSHRQGIRKIHTDIPLVHGQSCWLISFTGDILNRWALSVVGSLVLLQISLSIHSQCLYVTQAGHPKDSHWQYVSVRYHVFDYVLETVSHFFLPSMDTLAGSSPVQATYWSLELNKHKKGYCDRYQHQKQLLGP